MSEGSNYHDERIKEHETAIRRHEIKRLKELCIKYPHKAAEFLWEGHRMSIQTVMRDGELVNV